MPDDVRIRTFFVYRQGAISKTTFFMPLVHTGKHLNEIKTTIKCRQITPPVTPTHNSSSAGLGERKQLLLLLTKRPSTMQEIRTELDEGTSKKRQCRDIKALEGIPIYKFHHVHVL